MSVSIIIVNWNSKAFLSDCLQSIERTCESEDLQVVVVDGGSFDGCDQMIEDDFPWVDFVQVPENVGFGLSNNVGVSRAKGEFVLLLNPDTVMHEGSLSRLLETFQENEDAGIVAPRLLNTDGSLQKTSVHLRPTPLGLAFDSDRHRDAWWVKRGFLDAKKSMPAEAVPGACMLMRTEMFREVGGFGDQYFMYAEDMDLCLKVERLGFRVYYEPRAVVTHHGGGSSGGAFSRYSVIMIREATWTYMRTNFGRGKALAYRMLQGATALGRIGLLCLGLSGSGHTSEGRRTAIRKWFAVARWAAGIEVWARKAVEEGLARGLGINASIGGDLPTLAPTQRRFGAR